MYIYVTVKFSWLINIIYTIRKKLILYFYINNVINICLKPSMNLIKLVFLSISHLFQNSMQ